MRIPRTTLSAFSDPPTPEKVSPRAARIRQTVQDGLYKVDLDRLAGSVIASIEQADAIDDTKHGGIRHPDYTGDHACAAGSLG